MSSRKEIIICVIVCILINVFNAIIIATYFIPTLKIKGNNEVYVNLNSDYNDEGVIATYHGKNVSNEVITQGKVDVTKIGTYELTYTLKKGLGEKQVKRKIIVQDIGAPIIELKGEKTIHKAACEKYKEEGYTALDKEEGDLTEKVVVKEENDKIIYTVQDKSGNKAEVERKIVNEDKTAPTITLTGGNSYSVTQDSKYTDPGYKAIDNCDVDYTKDVKVSGSVDTTKLGNYKITYTVKDKAGNEAKVVRTVKVIKKLDGIIYLTFDDGPGGYTDDILAILAKNNIKATFFVTNQFPKYQSMIKKEYEAGHTVAVHTYSHSWSIYNSVDAYLEDFNKINNIIYEQTGQYAKYFRFPGGSSNTVSKKHSTGIMTKLANVMTENGYIYFDWNVDSGDTHKNNTPTYIINNIKKYVNGNGSYIILMHDIKKNTLAALPSVISYLKGRGYKFKAIDENTPIKHFKIAN